MFEFASGTGGAFNFFLRAMIMPEVLEVTKVIVSNHPNTLDVGMVRFIWCGAIDIG